MLRRSVIALMALVILTAPAFAKQPCTVAEVEQVVAQEKEALAALKHHQAELLKIPHVNGLAIGTLQDDEQGVIVLVDQCGPWEKEVNAAAVPGQPCPSVSHELEWRVPDQLDGVPVETIYDSESMRRFARVELGDGEGRRSGFAGCGRLVEKHPVVAAQRRYGFTPASSSRRFMKLWNSTRQRKESNCGSFLMIFKSHGRALGTCECMYSRCSSVASASPMTA